MGPRRKTLRRPPEPPRNAAEGSAWVRRYMIDLYDRRDGEAANWELIAETAFKIGFEAIDAAPDTRLKIDALNRLHAAAYDRLTQPDAGRTLEEMPRHA